MSIQLINLTPLLYTYLQEVSLREPEVLKKLREKTHELLSNANMQISPEQGQFMALLMNLMQAKKTLEIGTFTGYSALAVALALPANGKLVACDISAEWTDIGKPFWEEAGVAHKIDLRIAPAKETLQALIDGGEAGTFDFAFIDADKAGYSDYYELALTLVRKGGLIAVDNVLWGGDVADPAVNNNQTRCIRALNEKVYRDERVVMSMLPIGDGLTLAVKQ
ncbi:MAG: class I SAM-dependent methyltransferase [Gammaproteobacteria bacterium]